MIREGSRTRYLGGLPFNMKRVCNYLGEVGLVEERGLHLQTIVSDDLKPGLGQMEVITGPLA